MALYIPDYLQTQHYPALRMRQVLADTALQAGVVGNDGGLIVSQRASSANMSVDVAVGAGFVRGTTIGRQGLYHTYNDAVTNLPIASNASGNPRLDQIVLRIYDSIDGAAGADQATLEVIQGTASAAATLDTRTGAATLPDSCLRLADILVASGSASITNAVIRDRRPWARGFNTTRRGDATANYTTASTTPVTFASGTFDGRFEMGEQSEIEFSLNGISNNVGGSIAVMRLVIDSTVVRDCEIQNSAGLSTPFHLYYRTENGTSGSPTRGGTHTWAIQFFTNNGTNAATIRNNSVATRALLHVRELVIPTMINGATP